MYYSKPSWNLAGLIFMRFSCAMLCNGATRAWMGCCWKNFSCTSEILCSACTDCAQVSSIAAHFHECSWRHSAGFKWCHGWPFEIWLRQLHSGLWVWTICKRRHLACLAILESYASVVDQRARHNFREILAFKSSLPGCGQRPSTIPGGRPKQTVELFKPCIEAIVLRGAHEHKVVLAWGWVHK